MSLKLIKDSVITIFKHKMELTFASKYLQEIDKVAMFKLLKREKGQRLVINPLIHNIP